MIVNKIEGELMVVIYLIRHSEQLRDNGIMNTEDDSQQINEKIILSIVGEEKAKKLSELNELQDIDVIWSSSYVRAKQTAKYIAYKNNIDINIDCRFNERKLGNLNNLKELGKSKKFSFTEEQMLDIYLKNEYGESCQEVNQRMSIAIKEIIENNEDKRVAIVTHGAAMKFYLMNFCSLNNERKLVYRNQILDFSSPSIIKLVFDKEKLNSLKNININI